ncbi:MAG: hypothetical protein U5K56_16055 [Halioglobus sp.]|nr:hypothetical protein [Halioglobus sp.]
MRTVVGIRSNSRTRQASSHSDKLTPTFWFASWRQLAGVLSNENRALLRLMQEKQPRMVLELAELSGRATSHLLPAFRGMPDDPDSGHPGLCISGIG